MNSPQDYQQRKARLIAQADLERLRMRYAAMEIKALLAPAPTHSAAHWVAPVAGGALALLLPVLGKPKAQRLLRMLSLVVMAYKTVRKWKSAKQPAT